MARITAVALSVLSAAGYALLFPPFGASWLSWVLLVPLVLALRGGSAGRAAALGALWGWVATAGVIAWLVPTLHGHFERPLGWSLAFWALFSATALSPWYALALAGWARASRHRGPVAASLLFAATWTAAELLRTHLGFQSPWALLAHAHAGSPAVIQLASATGAYGVGSLVALVNAALAELLRTAWLRHRTPAPRPGWRPALAAAGLAGAAVALVVAGGSARLASADAESRGLDVLVVQGDVKPALRWRRSGASRVLRRYAGLTRDALRGSAPPDLVVWPENAVQTSLEDPVYGPPLRALPRGGVPFLVGAPRTGPDRAGVFNSAILLRPDGAVEHYDKRRLLPFVETGPLGSLRLGSGGDLEPGAWLAGGEPTLLEVGAERIAVSICLEAVYPALARDAARRGATLLVNLSNDGWFAGRGGDGQHFAHSVFRAVETGLPVVRAASTGISGVVAPDGRVVALAEPGEPAVLRVAVPAAPGRGSTLYVRGGDWFAVACLVVWLLALPATRLPAAAGKPVTTPDPRSDGHLGAPAAPTPRPR